MYRRLSRSQRTMSSPSPQTAPFLALVVALAAPTWAQPFDLVIATELSTDGVTFSPTIAASPGLTVHGRVVVRRSTAAAFAGATYAVWGDHVFSTPLAATGVARVAPFAFGAQSLSVFQSASSFRIDDARDTGNVPAIGILSQQRPPLTGAPADPANPAVVLRFQITTPPEAGLAHVHVPYDEIRNGLASVYDSITPPATMQTSANIAVDGAWLFVGGNPCLGQSLSTPPSQRVLLGQDVTFQASGEFGILQWYKNAAELLDSPGVRGSESSTLVLRSVDLADAGDYVLFGMCSHTDPVRLDVFCPADFNNDTFVDGFDYDAFVTCFEGGPCPTTQPARTADFNRDGFADAFDYDNFVAAFEESC